MGFNLKNLSAEVSAKSMAIDRAEKRTPTNGNKKRDRLARRFGKVGRSWLEKWARYYSPAKILSLVCNVASGAGVFFMVAFAFSALPGQWEYLIAGLALFGFEWCKREASDSFWDDYWSNGQTISWGRLSVNMGLLVVSVGLSLYGVYELVRKTDPGAQIVARQEAPGAKELIASINAKKEEVAEIKAVSKADRDDKANYNSKGKYLWPMMTKENASNDQITILQASILKAEDRLEKEYDLVYEDNKKIEAAWYDQIFVKYLFTLTFCFFFEIIFEICMGFLSKFDWKYHLLLESLERSNRPKRNGSHNLNGHRQAVPT